MRLEFVVLQPVTFEEYLRSKKIDSGLFRSGDSQLWTEWLVDFEQMHPDSFTSQKLYLINRIRRKYLLKETKAAESTIQKPASPKVIIKPKPKIG